MTDYFKMLALVHGLVFIGLMIVMLVFWGSPIAVGLCVGYGLIALGALTSSWNRE